MISKSFRIASKKGAGSPESAVDSIFIAGNVRAISLAFAFAHFHITCGVYVYSG